MTDTNWHLMWGDTRLGVLVLRRIDQPVFHCTFIAEPAFAPYEAVFEAEAAALGEGSEDHEALATDIAGLGLRLVGDPSGAVIDDPIFHVNRGEAWFRY